MILQLVIGVVATRVTIDVIGLKVYSTYSSIYGFIFFFSFMQSAIQSASNVMHSNYIKNDLKQDSFIGIILPNTIIFYFALCTLLYFLVISIVSSFNDLVNTIDLEVIILIIFSIYAVSGISTLLMNYLVILKKNKAHLTFSIFELLIKALSLVMLYLFNLDNLLDYTLLLFCSQLFFTLIVYLYFQFPTPYKLNFSFKYFLKFSRLIFSLSGEHISYSINGYGFSTMLVKFFGTQIGAIRNVAMQLTIIPSSLVSAFYSSIMPKMFGSGRSHLINIKDLQLAKFIFTTIILFTFPFIILSNKILTLWLGSEFPVSITVDFIEVFFISIYLDSIFLNLRANIDLSPNFKNYHRSLVFISIFYLISLGGLLYFFTNVQFALYSFILFTLFISFLRFRFIYNLTNSFEEKFYLKKYYILAIILTISMFTFLGYIGTKNVYYMILFSCIFYLSMLLVLNNKKDLSFHFNCFYKLFSVIIPKRNN